MPEVVEVNLTSRWLNNKISDKTLETIDILGGRYSRHPLTGVEMFRKALPLKIQKVGSKGKFMWIELSKGEKRWYVMNTYGLEGMWGFTKTKHSNIQFTLYDPTKEKRSYLYFTDSRNFGTVEIVSSVNILNKKLSSLAPDVLTTRFTENDFYNRLIKYVSVNKKRSDTEIIKLLMDQTDKKGLYSGLGNYLAPEALYEAKISPYCKVGNLIKNKTTVNRLSKAIKHVVKLSFMTADIGYLEHLPKSMDKYVKRLREELKTDPDEEIHPDIKIGNEKYKFKVYLQKKDPDNNPVEGAKIITGRTTYWVPAVQKTC